MFNQNTKLTKEYDESPPKKRVKFDPKLTKEYDGLSIKTKEFEEIILFFLNPDYYPNNDTKLKKFVIKLQKYDIMNIYIKLKNLIKRLKNKDIVPLLPKGGGKSFQLKNDYLPNLKLLLNIILDYTNIIYFF